MRRASLDPTVTLLLLAWLNLSGTLGAAEPEQKPAPKPQRSMAVWDTGQSSAQPLTQSVLTAKEGWRQVSASEKEDSFKGDAVLTNGRVFAVVRQGGSAVEVQ